MNWQEKNAKAEMLGAGIAGVGCLGIIGFFAVGVLILLLL